MKELETEQLRKLVETALPELDVVIGWGQGYDSFHPTPVFVRDAESVSRLIWNPFCVQNLTGYLVKAPALRPSDKTRRVGICVKGCDSRSLVALIQEKFLSRDQIHIFGVPCGGVVDWTRVQRLMTPFEEAALAPSVWTIRSARVRDGVLGVEDDRGSHRFDFGDVLARKCLRCVHPNPVLHDDLVGEPVMPRSAPEAAYRDVEELDALPLKGRLAFWQTELERCMRCYACRNACPLCVCQDRCIAETRDPKWLAQSTGLSEKFLFHFIHALHLTGRCTECGECERACPMEIPVTLIKEKLNKITGDLLGYEAGMDTEAVPPLLTFSPGDSE